jgi:hypothetical protein
VNDNRLYRALDSLLPHKNALEKHLKERIERRVGRLLGANSRAAGLFQVSVTAAENGQAIVNWKKVEAWREWAELNEGCYLLRTNILNWEAEQLWQAYIQLTEAEEAFRIQKGDLGIRPV